MRGSYLLLLLGWVGMVRVWGGCCADCMANCQKTQSYSYCMINPAPCSAVCHASGSAGQYVDCTTGNVLTCPANTFVTTWNIENTLSSCSPCTCPAGNYAAVACSSSANNGQCKACKICPLGTFIQTPCTLSTDRTCTSCAAGTYGLSDQTLLGANHCNACPAGTFQPLGGKTSCNTCSACPLGKYISTPCSSTLDIACGSCPSPYVTMNPSSSACKDACLAGFYHSGTSTCTQCLINKADSSTFCYSGTYLNCSNMGTTVDTRCVPCTGYGAPNVGYCPAGYEPDAKCDGQTMVNPQCNPCSAGMEKPTANTMSCTACKTGFYSDSNGAPSCSPCTNKAAVGSEYTAWTAAANYNGCPW